MFTSTEPSCSTTRLEEQVRRLRNRLADAWRQNGSSATIRRLEGLIQRRWQLLDEARGKCS
jgi:hypothetical protein